MSNNNERVIMPQDTIHAKGLSIGIYTNDFNNEFISLTDISRYKSDNTKITIQNWMRDRETLEFLGLWEKLHNPLFNGIEFDAIKKEAGLHSFTTSPEKWVKTLVLQVFPHRPVGRVSHRNPLLN